MKTINSVLMLTLFLILGTASVFAGNNKGSAKIDRVVYTAPNEATAEYTVSYRDETNNFFLDQNFISVDLSDSATSLNNAVQADARLKINTEIGPNTITDNNDVRLVAGFVD